MNNEQKPYDFMKEVVRKQPVDKAELLKKAGILIGSALAFGVIAAFAFAAVSPYAQDIFGSEESPKVDIPADDAPEDTGEAQAAAEDAAGEQAQAVVETPAATLTLDQYRELYSSMMDVADTAEKSIVTVIGLTNNTDWFNQSYESQRQLSGLVIANNGQDLFIATEYRIVENVERIQVKFWNETQVDARYLKHDPHTGLAVLKVPLSSLSAEAAAGIPAAMFGNSYSVTQGEPVMAVGSPAGYPDAVSYGAVTSLDNVVSTVDGEYDILITDITGSSEGSGVLINLQGEVIGLISQSFAGSGGNTVAAVGISQIKPLLERLSNSEPLIYSGITGQDVTAAVSEKTGIPEGIWVDTVQADSPAMLAGIQSGDVIVKVDEEDVTTMSKYQDYLESCSQDQVIRITALRKGTEGYVEITFDVTLGAL